MLIDKCKFLLQLLLKINANFSRFHCNKNLPYDHISEVGLLQQCLQLRKVSRAVCCA